MGNSNKMKNFNLLNKIYLLLILILFTGSIVKVWKYKTWAHYYYGTAISAPESYPVKIRTSELLTSGETSYINSDGAAGYYSEWGNGDYGASTEKRFLPTKLVLDYASYRDKSFYKDTIDLPVKLIDSVFKNHPSTGENQLTFSVGVANKGNIIVWLQGENYEIILLKHKIIAREPTTDQTRTTDKSLTKQKYLDQEFRIPDSIKRKFDLGLDKDANYIDSTSKHLSNQTK